MSKYRKAGPAQITYPWRSTLRTILWAVVAFAAMSPLIYTAATQQEPGQAVGWVATALAILAAVQRVMTLPVVDAFLRRYLPWLAATPRDDPGDGSLELADRVRESQGDA